MKIRRYTIGGITYSPVASSQQTTVQQGTTAEKISGTVKKEIIDILKESGIPSDVNAFLMNANSFLGKSTSLSSMSLFGGTNNDYSMSDLITIQKMANEVKWNKVRYDEAVKNLDSENAWSEVATDSRGYMYVSDEEGNIKTVDPNKFDPTKQYALTNEQMLALRERSEKFAMNSTLLNSMSSAIGMKTIQEYLVGIVEKLGTSSIQGYASKEQDQIINGIEHLMMSGADGYYKITDKKQARDVNAALHYLHSQLTPQMKRTLEATIAANGGDVNKDKYNFIGMILTQHIDSEQAVDFDTSATKSMGLDAASKSEKSDTLAERYASGSGAPPATREVLMNSTSGTPLFAYTQDLGAVLNNDGKTQLGNANLQDLFTNAYGMAIVDRRSVTFGDMLINSGDLSKIVYDGSTNLKRVYLPAKNVNGRITPDFELAKKIDDLNKKFINEGYTPGQIKSVLSENYPSLEYNEEMNMIVAKNSQLFLTFGAIASDDTYGSSLEDSSWLIPQSDEVDESWKDEYNRLISYRTNKSFKDEDETGNPETDWWFGYKFYKGNVFVPVTQPMLSSTIYNNQYWSKDAYTNMTQKAEAIERSRAREQGSNLKTSF